MDAPTRTDPATPRPDECLPCFLERVLQFGCDNTLSWSGRWRDRRMPRDTGLERRLERSGGYCDCEVLGNVWGPADEVEGLDAELDEELGRPPVAGPGCTGGVAELACSAWVPHRPGW